MTDTIPNDTSIPVRADLIAAVLQYLDTCPRGAVNRLAGALEQTIEQFAKQQPGAGEPPPQIEADA